MRIGVGSGNPVKRRAVESIVDQDDGSVGRATVEAVSVDSGVSEQPSGHAETIRGAENRARNVLAADARFDLGVGIEGGVAEFDGSEGLYLVMWAAVTDGDRTGRGAGPAIRLPDRIADRVRAGEELGPVMDDAFDHENSDGRSSSGSGAGSRSLKENEGAAGVLSGNIIDRRGALTDAVAGALGPFVTDAYE